MKMQSTILLCASLAAVGSANATPLRLDYSVENLGTGRFNYEFSLVLDDHDGTWVAGQGWAWFIFGDIEWTGGGGGFGVPSPLTDFLMETSDFPVGPWTSLVWTMGQHNGPTFGPALDYWIPRTVGEALRWAGTSTADLAQGELLFSTLAATVPGESPADFEVANRIEAAQVPEPASSALVGLGLAALLGSRRARSRRTTNPNATV